MREITCVVDVRAELGEGPVWDSALGLLWWVDIQGKLIHRYDFATGRDSAFHAPVRLGCLGLAERGGLVVAMANGFSFFDPKSGRFDPIVDPEAHLPQTRFNDGRTDRQGRFWAGTIFEVPGQPSEPIGSLWRLDADLSIHRMIPEVRCANGLAWSPDSRIMYFVDSAIREVRAYDFDASTGNVANRRTFIDLSNTGGGADGATVDAEGCYWLTIPKTGKVNRYDPDGRLVESIALPCDAPTCCEFGGPDLDILYVTTATFGRPAWELAGQPYAGSVFAIDAGVKGIAARPFGNNERLGRLHS